MMECAKCSGELVEYNFKGIVFKICKSCNVVFITKDNFDKMCKCFNANCQAVDLFSISPVKTKEDVVECFSCNSKMEKILINGILVDRCKKCQILAFDNGELSKYFSSFSENNDIEIMNNAKFIKTYCSQEGEEQTTSALNNNSIPKTPVLSGGKIYAKEKEFAVSYIDGWQMVFGLITLISIGACVASFTWGIPIGTILVMISFFLVKGFKIIAPQEALVFVLFGQYHGTLRKPGFYWVNPFCSTYNGCTWGSVSLKTRTLENAKQKINDKLGNPIEIGIMVTWEIKDTAMAVFNVENYHSFLSAQCDSALRNIARQYPYDSPEDSNVESLRNDSLEISEQLKNEIQNVVAIAGIRIINARITHLAYSTEIAAAMLQRQQASAVVEAKKAIVDGAIGIVEMALDKLEKNKNIVLDEKTKANMVNNLLVVLCGNKDSVPIIRNDKI